MWHTQRAGSGKAVTVRCVKNPWPRTRKVRKHCAPWVQTSMSFQDISMHGSKMPVLAGFPKIGFLFQVYGHACGYGQNPYSTAKNEKPSRHSAFSIPCKLQHFCICAKSLPVLFRRTLRPRHIYIYTYVYIYVLYI